MADNNAIHFLMFLTYEWNHVKCQPHCDTMASQPLVHFWLAVGDIQPNVS